MEIERFETHVKRTNQTAQSSRMSNRSHLIAGLNAEIGEINGLIQHTFVDYGTRDVNTEEMKSEIGDSLWYLIALAQSFDITLEDIMLHNINKLEKRLKHGK